MSSKLNIQTLKRSEIDEKAWNDFILASPQRSNYAMTWYLDVVWPDWEGIQVFYKNELKGLMPIRLSKKYGIAYCFQPLLTQFTGIFLAEMNGKEERKWAMKKRIIQAIVATIPTHLKRFVINCSPAFDYPLPFHWAGYELRTRYSYWLAHQADVQNLFKQFNERTRTYINKANKSGLVATPVTDVSALIDLSQRHDGYRIDYDLLNRLWKALYDHKVGKALEVRDADGRLHAGFIYHISGDQQVHLFSAKDPSLTQLGGMSLVIWESIKRAEEQIAWHDFEGSMLQPVEHFFRGFGTHPIPYLQVRHNRFPKFIKGLFE